MSTRPIATNDAAAAAAAIDHVRNARAAVAQREEAIASLGERHTAHAEASLQRAEALTRELHRTNPMNPRTAK